MPANHLQAITSQAKLTMMDEKELPSNMPMIANM